MKRFILMQCLSFLSIALFSNTYYYISPLGDDNNRGSIDKPWQDIEIASKKLLSGDTLFLRDGIYRIN